MGGTTNRVPPTCGKRYKKKLSGKDAHGKRRYVWRTCNRRKGHLLPCWMVN